MLIKDRIQKRIDVVEFMMKGNIHLVDPKGVMEYLLTVTKFLSVLSEEDRDYLQACQTSIEEKWEWKQ